MKIRGGGGGQGGIEAGPPWTLRGLPEPSFSCKPQFPDSGFPGASQKDTAWAEQRAGVQVPGALCLPKHPLESRTEALVFSFFLVDFPQSHLRVLAWAKGSSIPLICSTGFWSWKKNKFYKMEDGFVFFKSLNLCVLMFVTHRALLRARFRLGFPLAWV